MTPPKEPVFVPLKFDRMPVEEQRRRAKEFYETMVSRRTVRQFSPEPIPMEVLEYAIATAGRAPSGANQQPWTFCVVTNQDIKKRIREAAEAEESLNYHNRMSNEWLDALSHLGTNERKPHIEDAPALIIVFEQTYGSYVDEEGEERKVRHYYTKESVGIAVGFLLAALHEAGVAALTHTPSPMNFLAAILRRPKNEKAFVLIPVGYPAEGCVVPRITKKPIEDIAVWYE